MADERENKPDGFVLLKDSTLYLSLLIAAGSVVCLFISRAPTSFTGKIPLIGENFPLKLNAVYFVVLGPWIVALATAALWFETSRLDFGSLTPDQRRMKRGNANVLIVLLIIILLSSLFLSLQYFLILAPSEICSSRPHFEFLWKSFDGVTRITHCMSGTASINAEAPYYVEPQFVQAWGHVIAPLLTSFFLLKTWNSWRSKIY